MFLSNNTILEEYQDPVPIEDPCEENPDAEECEPTEGEEEKLVAEEDEEDSEDNGDNGDDGGDNDE